MPSTFNKKALMILVAAISTILSTKAFCDDAPRILKASQDLVWKKEGSPNSLNKITVSGWIEGSHWTRSSGYKAANIKFNFDITEPGILSLSKIRGCPSYPGITLVNATTKAEIKPLVYDCTIYGYVRYAVQDPGKYFVQVYAETPTPPITHLFQFYASFFKDSQPRVSKEGVIFYPDYSKPLFGKAYRDPSGLIWSDKLNGVPQAVLKNQEQAEAMCSKLGGRLPSLDEFERLAQYLGKGSANGYNYFLSDMETPILPFMGQHLSLLLFWTSAPTKVSDGCSCHKTKSTSSFYTSEGFITWEREGSRGYPIVCVSGP